MGQSSSNPSTLPAVALHCLRVTDGSPVAGQIEPFFDYLVGADDEAFEDSASLGRILKERQSREKDEGVVLKVYNAKSQRIRGGSFSSLTKSISGRKATGAENRRWLIRLHAGFFMAPLTGRPDADSAKMSRSRLRRWDCHYALAIRRTHWRACIMW